ncbi:MAG: glycine zipper 2TM domain-containing protein [Longimicrobiales bacterium]
MRRWLMILASAALPLGASPQRMDAQVLSGVVGAVTGTAAGGYITLSIVVTRAQFGHYLHDFEDLFDWKSAPIVIGAATGTALGVWWPNRLWSSLIFGSGGTALGAGVGYLTGRLIAERPEGRWAGAAIGAGLGMTLGSIAGIAWPRRVVPEAVSSAPRIPITIRVRVP